MTPVQQSSFYMAAGFHASTLNGWLRLTAELLITVAALFILIGLMKLLEDGSSVNHLRFLLYLFALATLLMLFFYLCGDINLSQSNDISEEMTMKPDWKKIGHLIWPIIRLITLLGYFPLAFAENDDPFPAIKIADGNVVNAVGGQMETSMKYALIGGGIIMVLVGIGVIIHRLREDSTNRDNGSFITTLIIAGLAITIGLILIAIGWDAASYQPT